MTSPIVTNLNFIATWGSVGLVKWGGGEFIALIPEHATRLEQLTEGPVQRTDDAAIKNAAGIRQ